VRLSSADVDRNPAIATLDFTANTCRDACYEESSISIFHLFVPVNGSGSSQTSNLGLLLLPLVYVGKRLPACKAEAQKV
jgi:hypothetical protein